MEKKRLLIRPQIPGPLIDFEKIETLLESNQFISPNTNRFENITVQILESNNFIKKRTIQKAIISVLKQAKLYCYITTPYFLPTRALKHAIIDASKRGVDVQILTSVRKKENLSLFVFKNNMLF